MRVTQRKEINLCSFAEKEKNRSKQDGEKESQ